ncbi:hypothetical protein ACEUAI_13270 [Aeromonas veronii]|uniref:hypothetical protein n=1 Tax=Aeromonas hydrophila TaxID=644 RepID=UPI002B4A8D58|nr:hypothetical protein [Aeromonas hydrophila]
MSIATQENTQTASISLKPNQRIMTFCDEMFDRMASCGRMYPACWMVKTREKLVEAGVVECKAHIPSEGEVFYFTEPGLAWFLALRPNLKRSPQ